MFSCLYNYSGSGYIMTFPRDSRGGSQGSFVSFSKGKRQRPRSVLLLCVVHVAVPLVSSYSPSPSCPLPLIHIHPYISWERKRSGLLCLLLRGKGDERPHSVRLLRAFTLVIPHAPPIILLYLLLPMLCTGCVYCCVTSLTGYLMYFLHYIWPPKGLRVVSSVLLRYSWKYSWWFLVFLSQMLILT